MRSDARDVLDVSFGAMDEGFGNVRSDVMGGLEGGTSHR